MNSTVPGRARSWSGLLPDSAVRPFRSALGEVLAGRAPLGKEHDPRLNQAEPVKEIRHLLARAHDHWSARAGIGVIDFGERPGVPAVAGNMRKHQETPWAQGALERGH